MSLPQLTRLDISGTNLAGPRCDHIPGLESRNDKPLEYIGLYNTANEAAYRRQIPAFAVIECFFIMFLILFFYKVSGDANEEQILTGCEAYMDRVEFLRRTLNDLFHCFRFEVSWPLIINYQVSRLTFRFRPTSIT